MMTKKRRKTPRGFEMSSEVRLDVVAVDVFGRDDDVIGCDGDVEGRIGEVLSGRDVMD